MSRFEGSLTQSGIVNSDRQRVGVLRVGTSERNCGANVEV